jgi:hypothetical protein
VHPKNKTKTNSISHLQNEALRRIKIIPSTREPINNITATRKQSKIDGDNCTTCISQSIIGVYTKVKVTNTTAKIIEIKTEIITTFFPSLIDEPFSSSYQVTMPNDAIKD